jgi:hypothetical protein
VPRASSSIQEFPKRATILREGFSFEVRAAANADAAASIVRVTGWSDRCAVYLQSLSPRAGVGPNDSVQIEWALYFGSDCALEQTAAAIATPTYNPAGSVREGLIFEARSHLATQWTLFARVMDPPGAGVTVNATVSMLVDHRGGSAPGFTLGSAGT